MKIALLTPTFSYYSGIDHVVQEQAEDYVKKGNKVTIFCLESDIKKSKDYEIKMFGMPKSFFWQRFYRLFLFLNFPLLINISKQLSCYDKVISHFYPMNWFSIVAKKRYKKKFNYYDYGVVPSKYFSEIPERIYMKLFDIFNNFTLRYVDQVTSISYYLAQPFEKRDGISIKVVYPKIDKKIFNSKVNGAHIRKKYKLDNSKVLLFIGRITPYKGIHLLIDVFKKVKKEIPDIKLLIGGKKTFPKYVKELEKKSGKGIILLGYISETEKPKYFAACDLYTTCTLWEGFNLPIVEAQSCGKRVVAFNICSHPEVVKEGTLVERNNIDAFAQAVIKELTIERKGVFIEK